MGLWDLLGDEWDKFVTDMGNVWDYAADTYTNLGDQLYSLPSDLGHTADALLSGSVSVPDAAKAALHSAEDRWANPIQGFREDPLGIIGDVGMAYGAAAGVPRAAAAGRRLLTEETGGMTFGDDAAAAARNSMEYQTGSRPAEGWAPDEAINDDFAARLMAETDSAPEAPATLQDLLRQKVLDRADEFGEIVGTPGGITQQVRGETAFTPKGQFIHELLRGSSIDPGGAGQVPTLSDDMAKLIEEADLQRSSMKAQMEAVPEMDAMVPHTANIMDSQGAAGIPPREGVAEAILGKTMPSQTTPEVVDMIQGMQGKVGPIGQMNPAKQEWLRKNTRVRGTTDMATDPWRATEFGASRSAGMGPAPEGDPMPWQNPNALDNMAEGSLSEGGLRPGGFSEPYSSSILDKANPPPQSMPWAMREVYGGGEDFIRPDAAYIFESMTTPEVKLASVEETLAASNGRSTLDRLLEELRAQGLDLLL